ncbi:Acg family FMN-binding oxidoreductase [Dactylosporangium sucinum]|uniref:NAD(P)H nitroreductase n=1 Tax=Dactylosporangium sucinum TaxID=1424081 RepID=A0A917U9D1_9ACTN|nr:nitroreductase family protein [Dactylosporangium sucinum]GGM68129.1 NAD(P)H nitroreductase [Dactylosporangium sucinum]
MTMLVGPASRTLTDAAVAALQAPSVLNTQPWRWHVERGTASLSADPSRRLARIDPDRRLLVLSCGAALHHACVTLAAGGADFAVELLPDDRAPDLMAIIRYRGETEPSPAAQRLRDAIAARRSDRRPFSGTRVPEAALERVRDAAQRAGARLHLVRAEELVEVIAAAGRSAAEEMADPAYRAELLAWLRPPGVGRDGVPVDTIARPGLRPVPIRDFTAAGYVPAIYSDADVTDREARYGIVVTDGDGPADWLRAGVTLSAVLLAATAEGLATSAMSDLVEEPTARVTLRRMLGNVGHPAVGVRIGVPAPGPLPRRAPRRPAAEMVEVVAELARG